MTVTIKDIARRAGVSHPTVSRALRGDPLVTPETTARIRRAAAELGYVPSAAARSLKTNRSRVIGVIVNRISDAFYSEVLDGIQAVLDVEGYTFFLSSANNDSEREKALARAMIGRGVDGLIVCSSFVSAQYRALLTARDTPLVVVHNRSADGAANAIEHDDRQASRIVTRHLIELGHTRIAFIGNARAGRESNERLQGMCDEMRSAELPVRSEYLVQVATGQLTQQDDAILSLLQQAEPPTAIVCFNDSIAISTIRMLQALGCRVPEDCSVVGFDNISFSAFVTPPLTTFDQPKSQLGEAAARMMLDLLRTHGRRDANVTPQVMTLLGNLLVRNSTGPSPIAT